MPPELREDLGELALAEADEIPDLVTVGQLRGELHAHSDWSDGTDTIEAMARAAAKRGYEYLAISDHSQSLAMAGGLTVERLRRQWAAIDEVRERVDIEILRAAEVDILADGELDYPDEVLAELA